MRLAELADGRDSAKTRKEEKELDQQDVDSQKKLFRNDWACELKVRVSCPYDLRLVLGN